MRYRELAEQIIRDIQADRLHGGSKMPSLRKAASLYDVSMTTAINCYRMLEEGGWIIARPQSGFYVAKPEVAQPTPQPPQFRSRLRSIATGRMVPTQQRALSEGGPLSLSMVSPELMPTAALQRSVKRGLKRLGDNIHLYPPAQGDRFLRTALEQHFAGYGFPFKADELVIANGCADAVRVALETVSAPGDGIAISSPYFSGLLQLLAEMRRKVVEIPCTAEGIDLDQLEFHLNKGSVAAGLFNTTHMNPQGISLSVAQKQRLAELANRYRVPIIEDDVYFELGHGRATPLPAKYWDRNGYLLWCGSISKTLSASFRLGWCLPGRYQAAYQRRATTDKYGISWLMQTALADFIDSGEYRTHLQKLRVQLARHIRDYRDFLAARLPDGAAISNPEGGTVLWLQIPGLNAKALQVEAERAGLDLRYGTSFTALDLYSDCVRINAGWPLDEHIAKMLDQFCKLTERHRQLSAGAEKQVG